MVRCGDMLSCCCFRALCICLSPHAFLVFPMELYASVPLLIDLPSIRLLEFCSEHSEENSSPIRATLKTYALEPSLEYGALSYTWGPTRDQTPISLNGRREDISETLGQILATLLQNEEIGRHGLTRLWVDGICINQRDDGEKSTQVAQMQEIYAQAEVVLVWIGPADEMTSLAFQTLAIFADNDGTPDGSTNLRRCQDDKSTARRLALDRMIQRSWFSRTWVIQEVVVARKVIVHWGSYTIDWETFNTGLQRATGSGFFTYTAQVAMATNIGNWRDDFRNYRDPAREEALYLRVLTKAAGDKLASNPRDKIYALRGIASDAFSEGIVVNYADSVEKVYIDCAKHIIRTRSDLRLLSLIRQKGRGTGVAGLPSWVPDWSQPMDLDGVLNRYYRFLPNRFFRANGTTQPRVSVPERDNTITIGGIEIDKVAAVVRPADLLSRPGAETVASSFAFLLQLIDVLHLQPEYSPSGEPTWLALFRTLTADRTPVSTRINPEYHKRNFSKFGIGALTKDHIDTFSSREFWDIISPSLDYIIIGKVLFVSTKGYIGLTEEGCVADDLIYIFEGGEVPFVMRATPRHLFQLHGEAYVHGFMDGEIFQGESIPLVSDFDIE